MGSSGYFCTGISSKMKNDVKRFYNRGILGVMAGLRYAQVSDFRTWGYI